MAGPGIGSGSPSHSSTANANSKCSEASRQAQLQLLRRAVHCRLETNVSADRTVTYALGCSTDPDVVARRPPGNANPNGSEANTNTMGSPPHRSPYSHHGMGTGVGAAAGALGFGPGMGAAGQLGFGQHRVGGAAAP